MVSSQGDGRQGGGQVLRTSANWSTHHGTARCVAHAVLLGAEGVSGAGRPGVRQVTQRVLEVGYKTSTPCGWKWNRKTAPPPLPLLNPPPAPLPR